MRRKQVYMLLSAAGAVLGLGATHASAAAPTATLSINGASGAWTAYASLDTAGDNIGLADLAIDIIGSNGIVVTGSSLGGTTAQSGVTAIPVNKNESGDKVGFNLENSAGVNGLDVAGAQSFLYSGANNPYPDAFVVQGLGVSGHTSFSTTIPTGTAGTSPIPYTVKWANPIEIAHGTYTGTSGALTVQAAAGSEGVQSLNVVSAGKWIGPGNISTDITVPGTVNIGTTTVASAPFISLSGTAAGSNSGSDALAGATVTPSSDDVNDQIVEHTTDGTHYDAIHIHEAGNGSDNADFNFAGFSAGSTIDMLLKFSTTTGGDPATNASVLSDIENYINGNDGTGITVSAVPAAIAASFPGTTYDLMLSATAGANDPFANFDFAAFSDSSVGAGSLTVSDIGVVPEPASLGLLVLGGVGLVGRRRSKKDSK